MKLSAVLIRLTMSIVLFLQTQAEIFETSANTSKGMSWLQELASGTSSKAHSRKRRFIQLPKSSTMELKWSINFPFDTYSDYKAKWQLAYANRLPFPAPMVAVARRLDENPEYMNSEDVNQNSYDYNNDVTPSNWQQGTPQRERTVLYKTLEDAIERVGGHGSHCLLRAICDIAEIPFDQGIIGEMINTFLTASIASLPEDPKDSEEYETYMEAELHGKLKGNCEQRYNKCRVSLFDLIPKLLRYFA
ncbi:uncharacterized protein [Palaemon carinicauda]|uniref:uncharacterized protein n=1 Tax=Palaemon carinicauda TaxID=392227 RepID=UPI0035B6447D